MRLRLSLKVSNIVPKTSGFRSVAVIPSCRRGGPPQPLQLLGLFTV